MNYILLICNALTFLRSIAIHSGKQTPLPEGSCPTFGSLFSTPFSQAAMHREFKIVLGLQNKHFQDIPLCDVEITVGKAVSSFSADQ